MTRSRKQDARTGKAPAAPPAAPRRPLWTLLVPLSLVLGTLVLDLRYVSRPAYTFDETYYFAFATGLGRWLADPSLAEATVNAVFREGNGHPPLPLFVMAVTGKLFMSREADFLFAVRLATALQFAALVLITYLFLKRAAGASAGILGAVLTLFSPRLFAHSLLATYDVPMVLYWMAATFAFYLGMTSRRWAAASGVMFGLALLTKINGFLLPLALWPWGLVFFGRKSLRAILSQAVLGPLIFFAGWPWLWLHPVDNTVNYFVEKLAIGAVPGAAASAAAAAAWRRVIPTLYFGSASPSGVPWHYPFVMTLFTMPLATLAGLVLSAVRAKREPSSRPLAALFAWSVLVQLLVFAFAMKPYDGVRLFAPMLALTASLAGIGLARLAAKGRGAVAAAALLVALSPAAEFFVYQPYGLSYYSPAVGGLPGANALGMEVTYFGEAVSPAQLAAINRLARDGETVAYAPMFKRLPWRMPVELMRYGYLSPALRPAAPSDRWDYLIFVNRGGEIDASDRENLARSVPIAENRLLGVLLSGAYRRREEPLREAADAPGQH